MPIDKVTGIFTPADQLFVGDVDLLQWIHSQRRDLNPTQRLGLQLGWPTRYIASLDTVGIGKTSLTCIDMMQRMLTYPGNYGFFGRAKYDDFKRTTYPVLKKMYPETHYPVKYFGGEKPTHMKIFCPMGGESRVDFIPFGQPTKWPSANLGWFCCDQAEELDEDWGERHWDELAYTRLGRIPGLPPEANRGWLTGNQYGWNWIYRMFFLKEGLTEKYKPEFFWLQAVDFRENESNLDEGYYDREIELGNENNVNRLVYARADTFVGRAIPEFNSKTSEKYVKEFTLDHTKHRYNLITSYDYGHQHPNALTLLAVEDIGRLNVVGDYAQPNREPSEHVDSWNKLERECNFDHRRSRCVGDWNLRRTDHRAKSGDTVENEYKRLGWKFHPAQKTHRSVMRLKEFFRVHPVHGPMIRIHPRCKGTQRALIQAVWDESHPEHVLKQKGDDLFSTLCYGVMEAPRLRLEESKKPAPPAGSWEHLQQARRSGLSPRMFDRG